MVGKRGWLVDAFCDRVLQHPEFRNRLFWLEDCNDADLHYLYAQAAALIQASLAEGFGLPLIEAANSGTPVIASDIQVFREIGDASFSYFNPLDAESLARCISTTLANPCAVAPISVLSWAESTAQLIKLIRDETYQFEVADSESPEAYDQPEHVSEHAAT
jgi:alpha-1,2-rhamnosyltransferase